MPSNRRTVLATMSAAVAPMFAGCTPCGDPFPMADFEVTPTAIDHEDEWRVEAELGVEFLNARDQFGLENAALAAFDATGRVVDTAPVGDLTWRTVPEDKRESGDCADRGSLERRGTLESEAFPRWIGVRYDRFGGGDPMRGDGVVAAYPALRTEAESDGRSESDENNSTDESISKKQQSNDTADTDGSEWERPVEPVSPSAYEPTLIPETRRANQRAEPRDPITAIDFRTRQPICPAAADDPALDVQSNVSARFEWHCAPPEDHFWPVLTAVSVEGSELIVEIGWQTGPRFRRLPCSPARQPYVATFDFQNASATPDTVRVRHLDAEGQIDLERTIERQEQ